MRNRVQIRAKGRRAKDREERKRVVRPGDAQVQREPEAWARAAGLQADPGDPGPEKVWGCVGTQGR